MSSQFAFNDRVVFTVPSTSGQYAPERLRLEPASTTVQVPPLLGVTVCIEALATSSAVEIWLLKRGGDPTADADHFLYKSTAVSDTFPLASYPGAHLRVKSGGTAGSTTVSASAD